MEEFIEPGESGTTTDRPALQRFLAYVKTHPVAYCIVHKVDRLARNRLDDAMIHYELRQAGVMLVSATENIDETPSGMLVHGIMSSIAEFYSLNLAAEVTKGLVQKAAAGAPRPRRRSVTSTSASATSWAVTFAPSKSIPTAPSTSPGRSTPTRRGTGRPRKSMRS